MTAHVSAVYYGQTPLGDGRPTIYLAGPTWFRSGKEDWHAQTISLLSGLGQAASLLIPRPADHNWEAGDAKAQRYWQNHWLARSDIRLFYFPWPAYMSYAEFGYWAGRGQTIAGLPAGNDKPDPINMVADLTGVPVYDDLVSAVGAVSKVCRYLKRHAPR